MVKNKKVFNYKRKIAFLLLFSMFLNIFTPFGVLLREGYAESNSDNIKSVELFDEYYPKDSIEKVENWIVNEWTGSGPGVEGGKLIKENGKLYVAKENGKKKGTYIVPIDNGLQFNFKPDNSNTGSRRPSEAYLMSQKPFENDNLYEFTFNSKRTKGSEPRGISFRIITGITDKRHTVTLESNNTVGPKNDNWNTLKEGDMRVTFYGTGKKQAFGFSFTGKSSQEENTYEFTNLSLKNITPASEPVVESDGLVGDEKVTGSVKGHENDKRSNFEGDIVHVLVNGQEVGTALVDENNNWSYEIEGGIKKGDKLEFYVSHPESKNVSETIEHPFKPDLHQPEVDDIKEGDEKVTGTGVPGDTIVVKDKDGEEIGRGEVGEDGKFKVDLYSPLGPDENIKIVPETPIGDEVKTGTESSANAPHNPDLHKPELDDVKEGDRQVTGTGVPGDTIVIKDKDGEEIGRGEVGEDGKFKVDLEEPLEEGEKIKAHPETNGKAGTPSDEKLVPYNPELHKPTITEAKEGEQVVKGKGIPGDTVVITDKDGNKLGSGTVGEDGKFEIEIDRPLIEGEIIKGKAVDGDKESEETQVEVTYSAEAHKPEIEEAKEGEDPVTGTGVPGDNITIVDEKGEKVGEGIVDKDGNFEIKPDRPLVEGEKITAVPDTDGNEGTSSDEKEVEFNPDYHKPVIEEAKEGEDPVKGTGVPGDNITIVDEKGEKVGEGIVDKDGNFEIKPDRPLVEGEKITAVPDTDGNEGTSSDEKEVEFNPDYHKPVIEEAKEGEDPVKGTGVPGDNITIVDEKGEKVGEGIVDKDGNFEIKPDRPLVEGEKITAIPETDGNKGTPSEEKEVDYNTELHKPTITEAKEGETVVKGKGIPGDTVVITDKDGNKLGSGTVGEDGKFEIEIDRPLIEGEIIKGKAVDGDKESEETQVEVTYSAEAHKPEIEEAKEGEDPVTGTGVPGDNITIVDEKGEKVGEGIVDKDGNFEIKPDRPLVEGEKITAVPDTDGNEGTSSDEKEVEFNPDYHKPVIEEAKEGEDPVKGTGVPGDKITLVDEEGEKVGEGTVGEDGKFEIKPDRPLVEGENITAIPETDGNKGTPSEEKEVGFNPEEHKPVIEEAKEGEGPVKGTGVPGDKIILVDEEGKELGEGTVGDDGRFEIKPDRPLVEGEKIKAIPEADGNKGTPSEDKEVDYNPELHKPNITEAKEGEEVVKGEGVPGDEIVITDEEGKELGSGTVDEDGKFEVKTNRPLIEGEEIGAVAKTGENESEESNVTVTYESSKHKPKVDPAEEGEELVKGEGFPGDEIVITDQEGNELGRGKVGEDGKFEIDINRPLKGGEEIIATPITGNNKGEAGEVKVKKKQVIVPEPGKPVEEDKDDSKEDEDKDKPIVDKDKHKPDMEEVKHDDKIIGGKANPGDNIVIIDKDGKEIGRTQVDKNGNFKVELKRPAKEGEELLVKVIRDGEEITEIILIVNPKGVSVYDKLNSEDHIAYIQGFEDATVRPEDPVTREEVSAVIYRLLKPSYRDTIRTTKTSFKDVGPKRWSRKHIGTLENGNIINGTGYGNFSPSRNITRAELVVMLSRLEKLDTRPNNDFTDIKGHWAEAEIKSAANKGWINGHGNNKFQPDKHLTRAEFVTMINNVLNRKVEKKDILPEAKGFKDLKKDKWYYEAMMEAINSHHYERKDNGFEKWTDIYYPNLDM